MTNKFDLIYDFLAREFFAGQIQKMTLSSNFIRKNFICKWQKQNIELGSLFISAQSVDIFIGLLHEMIHISNAGSQSIDVGANNYHNKFFWKKAVDLGFYVDKNANYGFSSLAISSHKKSVDTKTPELAKNTKLKAVFENFVETYDVDISEIKNKIIGEMTQTKNKLFFLKYECQCPPPYNSIRSGRRPNGKNPLDITCGRCQSEFKCVSEVG